MPKYNTKQRQLLLGFLQEHPDEVFCAHRLSEILSDKGISASAIYRNLAALESEGIVHRVCSDECKHIGYRYAAADACANHLHMKCSKCGCTYHMDVSVSSSIIDNVELSSNFMIDSASTVLYGICSACRNSDAMGEQSK